VKAPKIGPKTDFLKLEDGGPDGKGKRKQRYYTDDNGLQLLVVGDSRLWYSPWEVPTHLLKPGQKRAIKRVPLGSAHDVSYTVAVNSHLKIHEDIGRGKYPGASLKGVGRRKSGPTFESYGTPLVKNWAAKRKNEKDKRGYLKIIPMYCAAINPLPIEAIGTTQVLDVLRPMWDKTPTMAEEVRALIARVIDAAGREELRPKNEPASRAAIVAVLGEPKKRPPGARGGPMPALKYRDMPTFMTELRAIKTQSSRAMEALILSNLRTNPVRYLHIDHLDFVGDDDPDRPGPKWTVPNALMKVDDDEQDFVLPMVPRLVEVLQEQIAYLKETFPGKPVGLLFPGVDRETGQVTFDKPISENTMRDLVVWTMKRKATPHGFRATFQTWAENQLQDDEETAKFNPDAIGYCMAHNPGDEVKRRYRRDRLWKPRVGIHTAWARFIGKTPAKLRAVA
jgi:integrase